MDRATASLGMPVEAQPVEQPAPKPVSDLQKANDYANAMIKQEKIDRAEGRW